MSLTTRLGLPLDQPIVVLSLLRSCQLVTQALRLNLQEYEFSIKGVEWEIGGVALVYLKESW